MKIEIYREFKNGKRGKQTYAVYEGLKAIEEAWDEFSDIGASYPESYSWVAVVTKEPHELTKKERKEKVADRVRKALEANYRYDIDYDSSSHHEENGSYGGYDHMTGITITRGTVDGILDHILPKKTREQETILSYCIERLLRIYKTYDPSVWEYTIKPYYYGDEVSEIKLKREVSEGLLKDIIKLNQLTNIEKVFFVLEKEYGYILDSLKHCSKVEVKEVASENLVIGSKDYYVRLEKDVVDQYKNHTLPTGIVTPTGSMRDDYRLIDGYHRTAAVKQNNKKTTKVIVLMQE